MHWKLLLEGFGGNRHQKWKKVGNSRPGVLAKKLRRCEEEGGRSRISQGGPVTPSPLPPSTPTVNFARTRAVKVVRSTTTSTPSSKRKGGASQGVVVEFQWNSSAARTLYSRVYPHRVRFQGGASGASAPPSPGACLAHRTKKNDMLQQAYSTYVP
jgi:hypothetical protein